MNRQKAAVAALLLPCIFLASCGGETPKDLEVSGAKSGIAILQFLKEKAQEAQKPGGTLGVFTGLYLSQGIILPVKTAMMGIDIMRRFMEAEGQSNSDENFALLREIGGVLQVNIVDTLNRSTDRTTVLDQYIASLKNSTVLLDRKLAELTVLQEKQREDVKEKRTIARDLERTLKNALKNQEYGNAADMEEDVAAASAASTEISTKYEQTGDMIDRMEALSAIASKRLQAIENNREIMIAGLKVINVPGISDLNILEEGKSWRKKGGSGIFGD